MSNIIKLSGPTDAELDQQMIIALERYLADAKQGLLKGVVIAGVHADGALLSHVSGSLTYSHMIGAVELVKFDMLRSIADNG